VKLSSTIKIKVFVGDMAFGFYDKKLVPRFEFSENLLRAI
jgi:hypothetical protein